MICCEKGRIQGFHRRRRFVALTNCTVSENRIFANCSCHDPRPFHCTNALAGMAEV